LQKKLKKLNRFLKQAEPRIGVAGQEVQSNITDNESALIKSPHGYIQGYNGITIADSGNQIIISAEAVGSGPESGCFPRMLDNFEEHMQTITGKEELLKKALLEADSGFFSEENLQEAAKRGIAVLIPDPQFRQRVSSTEPQRGEGSPLDPYFAEKKEQKVPKKEYFTPEDVIYNRKEDTFTCPAGKVLPYKCTVEFKKRNTRGKRYSSKKSVCENCPLIDQCIKKRTDKKSFRTLYITEQKYEENLSSKMREKIDDPAYKELYSRRMQIIEPVFSNITYCKGMNRFTLRTEKKVDIQWKLYCIVHNIWKCIAPMAVKYA
jgi:hypothetical protein